MGVVLGYVQDSVKFRFTRRTGATIWGSMERDKWWRKPRRKSILRSGKILEPKEMYSVGCWETKFLVYGFNAGGRTG